MLIVLFDEAAGTKRITVDYVKRSWIGINGVAEPAQISREANCAFIIACRAFPDLI